MGAHVSIDLDEETNEVEQQAVMCKPIASDRRIVVRKGPTAEESSMPVKKAKQVKSSEPLVQKRNVIIRRNLHPLSSRLRQ